MNRRALSFAIVIAAALAAAARGADFGFTSGDQQSFSLIGSLHLHNAGAAPALNIEVEMLLPRNHIGQKIFGIDLLPEPLRVEDDRWMQKAARWKIDRLEPGAHCFILWIARAASSDISFDLERLRKGDFPVPLPIRSLYLRGETEGLRVGTGHLDRVLGLAGYVRKSLPQEQGPQPFPQAIAGPAGTGDLARAMTELCHANTIPCRTVGAYAKAASGDFCVDLEGRSWNEIYFPQSGWAPLDVSGAWPPGRKPNDVVIVQTVGHGGEPPAPGREFWGAVTGAGPGVRVTRRAYFSRTRDFQQESELIALFHSLRNAEGEGQLAALLALQAASGNSIVLGLVEPYLYHADMNIVRSVASVIGALRQGQAAMLLVDAMGRTPEADALLAAQLELLTGQAFGADRASWRSWVRRHLAAAPAD